MREQIKEAEKKRLEKKKDVEAKKAILAKIEQDKLARKRRADAEIAKREGRPSGPYDDVSASGSAAAAPAAAAPVEKKTAAQYTETRLRLQTPAGTITKAFPVEMTLFEVAHAITQENGTEVSSFTQNFPKKVFDSTDFGQTLKEAGMVPSAALIVK